MTQNEMKKQLETLHDTCKSLTHDKKVQIGSALYAYLRSASFCLLLAIDHCDEYYDPTEQEGDHE